MYVMAARALAFVVSPHGFGHAARACAVIQALGDRCGELRFEIFSTVPPWFFAQSLTAPHAVHPEVVDVGLVQRTPLEADLEATVRRLDELMAARVPTVDRLAASFRRLGCRLVVCDIAPFGIVAAHDAGLPAVLVENFTWDWIYRPLWRAHPGLERHGRALSRMFAAADLRVQAEPVCERVQAAEEVPPISRRGRADRATVRRRLQVEADRPLVLISMGGIPWRPLRLEALRRLERCRVVVVGLGTEPGAEGSLITLPFDSPFYHPDLVAASDLVVAKLGYSTVAEAYHAGVDLAYVTRPSFPESAVLARFVRTRMGGREISAGDVAQGRWAEEARRSPSGPGRRRERVNGADRAATRILELLG